MDVSGQFVELGREQHTLDTIRVLHRTVVSLRAALQQSRAELQAIRHQVDSHINCAAYANTIESLSVENHVLRESIISLKSINKVKNKTFPTLHTLKLMESQPSEDQKLVTLQNGSDDCKREPVNGDHEPLAIENGKTVETDGIDVGDQTLPSLPSQQYTPHITKGESEESEELDDIELIFTTVDTKEYSALQEDLVSFTDMDGWDTKLVGKNNAGDEVNGMVNVKHANYRNQIETDISKCGVVDENEPPNQHGRRNTLPNPSGYHPLKHREALTRSKSQLLLNFPQTSTAPLTAKFSDNKAQYTRSPRPILVESNLPKTESEAQTDITALPAQWRSESYLAHKVPHNFTTLPSKFVLPVKQSPPRKQSLRLCDKTQESRRVLLSDINFTSMVPELSRSADHLGHEVIKTSVLCKNYPRAFTYMKNPDSLLCDGSCMVRSPCDCHQPNSVWDCYQGSMISVASPSMQDLVSKRRHSMRPCASSYDANLSQARTFTSVPSSPTHSYRTHNLPSSSSSYYSTTPMVANFFTQSDGSSRVESKFPPSNLKHSNDSNKMRNKVTFKGVGYPGQSLPDLRLPLENESVEDSTDSLIDESEEFLRGSIDCMLTGVEWGHMSRRRASRRYSDPDIVREFLPPKSAQPFIAKFDHDLKIDYWVKVISAEGRVVVGRVRYVGPLPGRADTHVGVLLPNDNGNSDGLFNGRRFFDCETNHGLFVPFKKVVMAWRT